MKNHYKNLGVHKFATDAEIKSAYGALARECHPDHHANDPDKAARMADLNVSYNVLKMKYSRKEYDTQLSLIGKTCTACKGKAVIWKQKGFTKKIAVPCTECGGSGSREGA